jgi:hypothetical protein
VVKISLPIRPSFPITTTKRIGDSSGQSAGTSGSTLVISFLACTAAATRIGGGSLEVGIGSKLIVGVEPMPFECRLAEAAGAVGAGEVVARSRATTSLRTNPDRRHQKPRFSRPREKNLGPSERASYNRSSHSPPVRRLKYSIALVVGQPNPPSRCARNARESRSWQLSHRGSRPFLSEKIGLSNNPARLRAMMKVE